MTGDDGGLPQRQRDTEGLVRAEDAAQIGDLAHAERIPLHELTPIAASLEEVFLELTTDAPEAQ